MDQPIDASLGDLRAIAHALCEDNKIKELMIDDLLAIRKPKPSRDFAEATDHAALIEQATARELLTIQLHYCNDEDTKKRVENYLQVLRYIEPAKATPEVADTTSPIKNATPKELHNVMIALCEDKDAKKRIDNHLQLLRRSKTGGAATVGADPAGLLDSVTEMELRAIGIAMSDADQDMRKRLLESLHVLSVFGELHDTEVKKATFKCWTCKQFVNKGDNTPCIYHPGAHSHFFTGLKGPQGHTNDVTGRVEEGMIPEMDLPAPVDRWSCCFRPAINRGCKTRRHYR